MALPTLATQLRDSVVTDAVARFEIITTITNRGDLPDKGAFVMEIIEVDDPKRDVLLRVADVGDLTEYRTDRSKAVLFGESFYREATLTKVYDAIQDAINAKDFIQEEINQLTADWRQFITDFQANPAEELAFPQADIGVLTPLIATYNNTVTLRKQQEEDVADKTTECAELLTESGDAAAAAVAAQASLDALNTGSAALTASIAALTAIQTELTATGKTQSRIEATFLAWDNQGALLTGTKDQIEAELDSPGGAFRVYYPNLQDAITTLAQDIASATAANTELSQQIIAQTGLRDDAVQAQTDAVAAKAACDAELVSLQAVLDELEALEQQQLNTIVALCPTFTP